MITAEQANKLTREKLELDQHMRQKGNLEYSLYVAVSEGKFSIDFQDLSEDRKLELEKVGFKVTKNDSLSRIEWNKT